jgi:hypothetical protein
MSHKKRRPPSKQRTVFVPTYGPIDLMMASTTEPMPISKRTHQLTCMHQGLTAMETAAKPTDQDWRRCADPVNLLETLVLESGYSAGKGIEHPQGWWPGCDGEPVQVTDENGLIKDAITALALAVRRFFDSGTLRLDGPGIQAVRAVIEDYTTMLETLPQRTMIDAHRRAERRVMQINRGKTRPHDVVVRKT